MTSPPSADLPVPASALAIGAHPDDVEFGCGGTLAKWADAGADVHVLVLTDGSKGTWDAEADLASLAATRRREQEAAASVLGLADVMFLGAVDGELVSELETRARVCEVLRRVRPAVVLGHDPWKRYRLHPDHRHAGELTIDAIVAARDPHYFPEQRLAPHRPAGLLLFEAEVVDHLERIDGWLDRKMAGLLCHRSQWRSTLRIDADAPDADEQRAAFEARVRERARDAGAEAGVGPAEDFKLIENL